MDRFNFRTRNNNRATMPDRPVVANSVESTIDSPIRGAHPKRKEPFMKRKLARVASIVVIVALLAGGAFYFFKSNTANMIDSGYQAVFLTNGQVYFGKLQIVNDSYMKITHVYYIQNSNVATPQGGTSATNIELVPLIKAVHGPKDEMVIAKSQVLFFENLNDAGQAAKLISGDKTK